MTVVIECFHYGRFDFVWPKRLLSWPCRPLDWPLRPFDWSRRPLIDRFGLLIGCVGLLIGRVGFFLRPCGLTLLGHHSLAWPDPIVAGRLSIGDYKRPLRKGLVQCLASCSTHYSAAMFYSWLADKNSANINIPHEIFNFLWCLTKVQPYQCILVRFYR